MQTEKRYKEKEGVESPTKKAKNAAATASAVGVDAHGSSNQLFLRLMHQKADALMVNPPRSFSKSGVLHCSKHDTLPFIVKRLDEHKILSMPVCTFGRNVFSGFVDIADCVRYVTTHFSNANPQTWDDFDRLWRNIDGFSATTVEQVMQADAISQGNLKVAPLHPIPAGYSLFSAFETIVRGGYERVAVVNAEGQISTIISQSMLVDFLVDNMELLGDLRGRRVSDFVGLHAGAPCLVKESDRVISGFKKMRRWGVSGLGVVNDDGALVDVLSERDLRGNKLDAVSFWGLYGRVDAFKTQIRASYAEVPFRVCTVKQSQSLEHCLRDMSTKRIRHLFVCDAENRPIKTITSLDLLRQALHTPIEA